MSKIRFDLTVQELTELVELLDNQLFRMKFIDTKVPGHKINPEKVRVASGAVNILKTSLNTAKGFKTRVA